MLNEQGTPEAHRGGGAEEAEEGFGNRETEQLGNPDDS
jgi:hypothetical protein